jgi:hypothetical protein
MKKEILFNNPKHLKMENLISISKLFQ